MTISNDVKVQHGIWIDLQILQQAGLGEQIQILVEPGEIRLVPETESTQKGVETSEFVPVDQDPIVGLFEGPPTLSQDVEDILQNQRSEQRDLLSGM